MQTGSRYGLKTRAEVAALKAEEEDKGKKKGKKSARSRTPKGGKKSATEKRGTVKPRCAIDHVFVHFATYFYFIT